MLYDIHAHLDYFNEKELKEIVKNAEKTNLKIVITNSTDLKSCKKNLKLSRKYKIIKFATGIYPSDKITKKDLNEFEKFVLENKNEIIAIGEIGMDFKKNFQKPIRGPKNNEAFVFAPRRFPKNEDGKSPKEFDKIKTQEIQETIFIFQLNLAQRLNLPVIIHTRKAEKEVLEILKNYKDLKIILHCFSGKLKLIQQAKDLGYYFSIPTNIVRSEQFQKMVKELPKDKILTETDSPFLSHFPGKQNQPAYIKESIKKISEIWKMGKEEVEEIIEKNFERVFN